MAVSRNVLILFWSLIFVVLITIIHIGWKKNATIKLNKLYDFSSYFSDIDIHSRGGEFGLLKFYNALFKNEKVILWWEPEGAYRYYKKEKKLGWRCGSCQLTSNKTTISDEQTSAVVFLYRYAKPKIMPHASLRRMDQLYVWYTGESSSTLLIGRQMTFKYEDSVKFNATMSYRGDADICQQYKFGIDGETIEKNLTKILKRKRKGGITFVSNCNGTASALFRIGYLRMIQRLFPITGYGECFENVSISRHDYKSMFHLIRQYKFYFAFENSYHCTDYITEKFSNGILGDAVPVVWGPREADYLKRLPPKSFIHVDNYKTVNDLVDYLNYLDNNDTAYMEYFRWRTILEKKRESKYLIQWRATGFCQLCRMVHGINVDDIYNSKYDASSPRPLFTPTVAQRTVASLKQWIQNDDKDCFKTYFPFPV